MTRFLAIGIDPGRDGGLGVLNERGEFVSAHRPNWDGVALSSSTVEVLSDLSFQPWDDWEPCDVFAAVEEPLMFVGGTQAGMAKSLRSVAISAGVWVGACSAVHIPAELVAPRTWQAAIVGRQGKITRDQRKDVSRRLACAMFGPAAAEALSLAGGAIHDGMAEALLIAEWLRQKVVAGNLASSGTGVRTKTGTRFCSSPGFPGMRQ